MSTHVLLGAVLFVCAAVAGLAAAAAICARVEGYPDGPPAGNPPVVALIAGAALIGGIAGAHADPTRLGLIALVAGSFVGAWYCDVVRGIVPDVFTLGPLAVLLIVAIVRHDPRWMISAAIVGVPFAGAAFLSKGRGLGWGDVKLAAVAGAILGVSNALLACALAAFAAGAGAKLRPAAAPDGTVVAARPLAFAPYLIGAAAIFTAWSSL